MNRDSTTDTLTITSWPFAKTNCRYTNNWRCTKWYSGPKTAFAKCSWHPSTRLYEGTFAYIATYKGLTCWQCLATSLLKCLPLTMPSGPGHIANETRVLSQCWLDLSPLLLWLKLWLKMEFRKTKSMYIYILYSWNRSLLNYFSVVNKNF